MTKSLDKKNLSFLLPYIIIKVLLVSAALIFFIKPDIIIYHRALICSFLVMLALSLMAIKSIFNAGFSNIIRHYFVKKEECRDQECLLRHKKNKFILFGSILQCLLATSFAVSGLLLAAYILFKPEKAMIYAQIYCGIFAFSIIAVLIFAPLINFIGYYYCKKQIEKHHDEFFKTVANNQDDFIRFLNVLHNILNVLLSVHFYACHLFATRKQFTANQIFYDRGDRVEKSYTKLTPDEVASVTNDTMAHICKHKVDKNKLQTIDKITHENKEYYIFSYSDDEKRVFEKISNDDDKNDPKDIIFSIKRKEVHKEELKNAILAKENDNKPSLLVEKITTMRSNTNTYMIYGDKNDGNIYRLEMQEIVDKKKAGIAFNMIGLEMAPLKIFRNE